MKCLICGEDAKTEFCEECEKAADENILNNEAKMTGEEIVLIL